MRVSANKVHPTLENEIIDTFYQLIADLKDLKEVKKFFDDFVSRLELLGFAKRLAIHYWLAKGRSYENIKENLKVSSATISALQSSNQKPGIKTAVVKIDADRWSEEWSKKIQKLIGQ